MKSKKFIVELEVKTIAYWKRNENIPEHIEIEINRSLQCTGLKFKVCTIREVEGK